ncbi:MAG TPA: transcriptional regulator [Anaerolineales bacterium]|nr:transcriptional regulator [Anaerolineales bacterium]
MANQPENEAIKPLADIDKLVHEPARLMILATLHVVESADFLFVERQTGLTRGNLSAHMSKLENAGYISITKEFVNKIPRTLLRITEKGRTTLLDYTQNMKQVLDKLK